MASEIQHWGPGINCEIRRRARGDSSASEGRLGRKGTKGWRRRLHSDKDGVVGESGCRYGRRRGRGAYGEAAFNGSDGGRGGAGSHQRHSGKGEGMQKARARGLREMVGTGSEEARVKCACAGRREGTRMEWRRSGGSARIEFHTEEWLEMYHRYPPKNWCVCIRGALSLCVEN